MQSELEIFHSGMKVGYLIENNRNDWRLAYLPVSNMPNQRVSMRFPNKENAFDGSNVVEFFRNYLPGPQLHRLIAEQLGFSAGNDFALVSELCAETFGALSLRPPDSGYFDQGELREINSEELRNIIAALRLNPLLTKVEGFRKSLPGGYAKIPVQSHNERLFLPLGNELSTHIIKTAVGDRRESLENESFCTNLAQALALPTANLTLRHGQLSYLLIERFDRHFHKDKIEMIHAEDFCQLSLLPPEKNYQREGGLTAAECIHLLRVYSVQPAVDIKLFLRWLMFNFFIGNGEAPAKKLSFLHTEQGPRLAPFYGLSSTHIYDHLNPRLAMRLGNEDRPDWLIPDRWREFADQAGIKAKYLLHMLESMSVEIAELVGEVEAAWRSLNGYAAVTTTIRKLIESRARQIVVALQAEDL